MKPVAFKGGTTTLLAPKGRQYSENVAGIDPLPVWTDGEQCVSCWKMSLRERLHILFRGYIWLAVLSGSSQPPVALEACREYLRES